MHQIVHQSIKKPRPGLGFEDGAKRTRTADPLHAMKQDASLRVILLQRSWVIVALCFEWNRAQVGEPPQPFRWRCPCRWGHCINQGHCRRC